MQIRTCENLFLCKSLYTPYVNVYLPAFMHAYLKEVIFATYTFTYVNAISVR